MTAVHALPMAFALLGGTLLGVVFFGGLWWTVRRGMHSSAPALWFSVSWLVRSTAVMGGFYAVSRGEWQRLPACLLGFLLARWVLLRLHRARVGRRWPPQPAAMT